MNTIYDWVSLAIFAGLIVLFLQRSTSGQKDASLLHYLGAGAGCALANYLGDQGQDLLAIIALAVTIGFVVYYLRPFQRPSNP